MFGLTRETQVYVHRAPVDFRKSVNGLAALVEQSMQLNPFQEACFVFGNKRRDKIKLLFWRNNGFWLCYKRLEQERFVWPKRDTEVIELTMQQLEWLLEGVNIDAMKGHRTLHYTQAA
jgi:transposase